jgi:ferredoxin
MIVVNDRFCPQNHRCPAVSYCPQRAIVQEDIYSAPRIDHDLCTECGACTQVCRTFSLVHDEVAVAEAATIG